MYDKQYYENFKTKNTEKIREKILCEVCGGSYTYFTKSIHFQTAKHRSKGESLKPETKGLKILEDLNNKVKHVDRRTLKKYNIVLENGMYKIAE